MEVASKAKLIKELADIDKIGTGSLPRGTYSSLAKKYGIAPNSVTEIHLKMRGEFTGRNPEKNLNQDPIKQEDFSLIAIKQTLARMEGCIQGLAPFHPRLSSYMMDQLNVLYRYLYVQEHNDGDPKKLTLKPKEGWENIDRQILKNNIIDNRIMNQDAQQEEPEGIEEEGSL